MLYIADVTFFWIAMCIPEGGVMEPGLPMILIPQSQAESLLKKKWNIG